jgi:hypothetical protein
MPSLNPGTATLTESSIFVTMSVNVVLSGQVDVQANAYLWQSSADGGTTWTAAPGTTDSPTYAALDSGLAGQIVRCVVTATNIFSGLSLQTISGSVSIAAVPTSATPPTVSTISISPTSGGAGQEFSCSVTTAADPDVALSYQWRILASAIYTNVGIGKTYTLSSAWAGGELFCEVTARNTSGVYLGVTSIPTSGLITSVTTPSAPQNVRVGSVDTSTKQVVINWDAPASIGGSAITDYEYQINGTGMLSSTSWYSAGAVLTLSLILPVVGGTYTFAVRAANGYGAGPSSPLGFLLSGTLITSSPVTSQKNFIYPVTETVTNTPDTDKGYHTYLAKFNMRDCTDTVAAGIFFNMGSSLTSSSGTYYVEIVKYKDSSLAERYGLIITSDAGASLAQDYLANIIGFSDVTNQVKEVKNNLPKALKNISDNIDRPKYNQKVDEIIQLKVVHYPEDPSVGNTTGAGQSVIRVYINNLEVLMWKVISTGAIVSYQGKNTRTLYPPNLPKKISLATPSSGTVFGVYTSSWSQYVWGTKTSTGGYDYTYATTSQTPIFLELYATETPLVDPAENYYFSSKAFLTGLALSKREASTEKSFMMQTQPAVSGLASYDVQYTLPAATTATVSPIAYLLEYFPGDRPADQDYKQMLYVYSDALNYSALVNTGFRGKIFISIICHTLSGLKRTQTRTMLSIQDYNSIHINCLLMQNNRFLKL